MRLSLLCKKTGAIALAQLGLMAGRLAGYQAGRQNAATFRDFKSTYILGETLEI